MTKYSVRTLSTDEKLDLLNDNEKSTRETWPIPLSFYYAYVPLILFTQASLEAISNPEIIRDDLFYDCTVHSIVGGILAWIMYHCAYKKLGTRWIGLFVYLSPIYMLIVFINSTESLEYLLLSTPLFIAYAFFWVYSRRLYAINIKMKTVSNIIQTIDEKMKPA